MPQDHARMTVTETRIYRFAFALEPEVVFSFDIKAPDETDAKLILKRSFEQMLQDLDADLYQSDTLKEPL